MTELYEILKTLEKTKEKYEKAIKHLKKSIYILEEETVKKDTVLDAGVNTVNISEIETSNDLWADCISVLSASDTPMNTKMIVKALRQLGYGENESALRVRVQRLMRSIRNTDENATVRKLIKWDERFRKLGGLEYVYSSIEYSKKS